MKIDEINPWFKTKNWIRCVSIKINIGWVLWEWKKKKHICNLQWNVLPIADEAQMSLKLFPLNLAVDSAFLESLQRYYEFDGVLFHINKANKTVFRVDCNRYVWCKQKNRETITKMLNDNEINNKQTCLICCSHIHNEIFKFRCRNRASNLFRRDSMNSSIRNVSVVFAEISTANWWIGAAGP